MTARASQLVQMVQEARRPTPWWLAWIIVMVVTVVVSPYGFSLGNLVLGDPASASAWYPCVDAIAALVVLLALFLWVRLKEGRPFATVGFRSGRGSVRLLVGFVIGAAMMSAGVLLGLVLGLFENGRSTHTVDGPSALPALVPLALLLLLQAAGQEAVTRGYLLQMSVRQLPAWVAIIGTSALVAVIHTLNPLMVLNLFLYATFAALVALQQGSLWLVIGIQAGWTCFQGNVFGLPMGGIDEASAVFSIGPTPETSTLVSGGAFGLEAGLLGTVVLAAATVVAYLRLRRTTRVVPDTTPAETASERSPRREPTNVTP